MGDGIMMRDLINTARTIEHVRSHELDRLREAIGLDEQRQKRIVFDITSTMVSELLVRMKKILNLVTNYQTRSTSITFLRFKRSYISWRIITVRTTLSSEHSTECMSGP